MAVAKKVARKSGTVKFTLDGSPIASSNLVEMSSLERYLATQIKVDGVPGNFEKTDRATGKVTRRVGVSTSGNIVTVEAMLPFKKRYIKYLAKRFLCMASLRDFVRVVAVGKNAYSFRYFAAAKDSVKA